MEEGINIRKELGVSLYVAGGYLDLGREYHKLIKSKAP